MKKTPTPKHNRPPALGAPKRAPAPYTKLSITIDPNVLAEIDARGGERSHNISRDLARYAALLRAARATLRNCLTAAELSAIMDIQNGHWYRDQLYADEIWANVEDGCRLDGLDQKWKIDGAALVEKIKTLDLVSVHALADACERFWHAVGQGESTRDPARALD